jgi:hypothetical protein
MGPRIGLEAVAKRKNPVTVELNSGLPALSTDMRLGGPQSRSGRGGEEKKIPSLSLPGIEPLTSSLSLVTMLSELP